MSNNNANSSSTDNNNSNNNPNEEAGAPGPPTGFVPFRVPGPTQAPVRNQMTAFFIEELADAMSTQLVPDFESFGLDESHSDNGSQSSKSDTGAPVALLCTICGRRQERIRYVVCGHRACTSCTKKLWWSRINRPDRARDPWPTSIPCPFCRADVTAVVDEREDAVESVFSAVSVLWAPVVVVDGEATSGIAADGGGNGGTRVPGTAGRGGQGMLIVDWILMRSRDALWRLQLERAAAADGVHEAANNGEGRAWQNGELDWNEFFFD